MNLPTQLSLLRIPLTFLIMGLLFLPGWPAKACALVGFLLAGLTDWLDGFLARRWGQSSPLGALLDPIADKVLVLGLFLAFIQLRMVPAWMVLVIVLRESVITGVRLFAASRRIVLAAAIEGKQKTVSQLLAIVVILCVMLIREVAGPDGLSEAAESGMDAVVLGLLWVTVILTVVSGASFFWRHRGVLLEAVTK